jgi:acyl-CoA thioester hydrolase
MQKKFEIDIEIRFADIDMLGHVNNAKYVVYIEHARMKFSDLILPEIDWSKEGFILARTEMDYVQPVYLHDNATVKCWCSHIGSKSFSLEYEVVVRRKDKELTCAKAKTVLVAFDYANQKSMSIPDHWKSKLLNYLNQDQA